MVINTCDFWFAILQVLISFPQALEEILATTEVPPNPTDHESSDMDREDNEAPCPDICDSATQHRTQGTHTCKMVCL